VAIGLDAILEWNAEALPEAYDAVAEALGPQGRAEGAASAFRSLVEQTGLERSLAKNNIDPKILAAVMMSKENKPMLENNAQPISSDDALELARRTLSFS
jgi:alcohol dehydrogenase class IV